MGIAYRTFKDEDIEKIRSSLGTSKHEFNTMGKVTWDRFSKPPLSKCFIRKRSVLGRMTGKFVGRVSPDSPWYGDAIVYVDPEYTRLYPDMLQYAESTFAGTDDNGYKYLNNKRIPG